MAVILTTRQASIDSFFEFAEGVNPFDFIDIVNDSENQSGRDFSSADGEFEYKTHFLVNETMAIQLGIIGVKIDIFTVDPRLRAQTSADAIKTCEIRFPTPPPPPPQKVNDTRPSRPTTSWLGNLISLLVSKKTSLRLPAGITVPGRRQPPAASSLRQASRNARSNGRDPAAMTSGGLFSAITPLNAISRDSTNTRPTSDRTQVRSTGASTRGRQSLASIRDEQKRQKRSVQSNEMTEALVRPTLATTIAPVSFVELLPIKKEYERVISIKKHDVAGAERLFASVSVIPGRAATRTFEKKVIEIQHGKELMEFLANPEPPDLSLVSAAFAEVAIKLQKTDPTLRSVRIFRIITNPNMNRVVVDDVADLSFDDNDTLLFTDIVDNIKPNRIIYRAAVMNGDGSIGEFSSIVIPTFKKVSDPLDTAAVPISIRAINLTDAVQVRVTTLSDDIFTMRLLRQELGKTGSFSDGVEVIPSEDGENLIVVDGGSNSFEFVDKTCILGRKYRYFCALRVGQAGMASIGQEIISDEDEILVRKFYTGSVPFAISVAEPTTEQDDNNATTVSFEISVEQTTDLFTAVIKSLQDAGVGTDFISNLQQDDIKTKLFTMFLVERFEYSTGRKASFGVVPAGRFVDSPATRLPRSIPAPLPGERYEYIIKTCLQQPEVFLQSSNVGLVNRYGDEISRKGSRFARLIYDNLGVLPPESDVRDGKSIESLLLESQIGQENTAEVSIAASSPTIGELTVTKKSFYSSLAWRVSGNIDNVSYFLIYCTLNGHEQLLGSVACGRSSPLYMFRDDRFFDEVGEKSYIVKAVSFNDDEIVQSAPAVTNRLFSIPENLVVGTMFSSFGNKSEIQAVAPEDFSPPAKKVVLPPIIPLLPQPIPEAPALSRRPVRPRRLQPVPIRPVLGRSRPTRPVRRPAVRNERPAARAIAANVETEVVTRPARKRRPAPSSRPPARPAAPRPAPSNNPRRRR